MMQGRWSRSLSRVGAAVLIGGLVLTNYGGGSMPAEAHDQHNEAYSHSNPFRQILDKLNDVLAKLNSGGTAGGGGATSAAGNYTMRLEGQWAGGTPPSVNLEVREGVFRWSHFLLVLFLISVPAGWLALRRGAFESRRWAEASFTPFGKARD